MQETKQMPATREADREENGHCLPSRAAQQGGRRMPGAREEPLEEGVVSLHEAVVILLRKVG